MRWLEVELEAFHHDVAPAGIAVCKVLSVHEREPLEDLANEIERFVHPCKRKDVPRHEAREYEDDDLWRRRWAEDFEQLDAMIASIALELALSEELRMLCLILIAGLDRF